MCQAQNEEPGRKKRARKPRAPKVKPGSHPQALTINYPLSLFNVNSKTKDWRSIAVFDKDLKKLADKGKPYIELAQAQDMEDIWLYENWFYGMKNGVIMESGALNGLLFSTSYMFENFANWTAIHVGMFLSCLLVLANVLQRLILKTMAI